MLRTTLMAAAAASMISLVSAEQAQAGTFYLPPPGVTAPATGTVTFQTFIGPVTCSVRSSWRMQNNVPSLVTSTLTGPNCFLVTLNGFGSLVAPTPSTLPSGMNSQVILNWSVSGGSTCMSSASAGIFDNPTSTVSFTGSGVSCVASGTLTFPGLTLLP